MRTVIQIDCSMDISFDTSGLTDRQIRKAKSEILKSIKDTIRYNCSPVLFYLEHSDSTVEYETTNVKNLKCSIAD